MYSQHPTLDYRYNLPFISIFHTVTLNLIISLFFIKLTFTIKSHKSNYFTQTAISNDLFTNIYDKPNHGVFFHYL